ncbi:MAG TPA: efflux RND transporter permease subunit [Acidobacteriota bacterium]|nr:efflux RND transporter permease subunit [Acidobacteriota bacterium]
MRLVKAALANPYAVIVVVLAIIILGITAVMRIPTDLLPAFKTPAVQILTLYPGMPADVMERDITTRLERWTGQSNGIALQESKSMIGVSVVKDYFRPDIDPNTAMSQVTSLAMSDLYYLPPGTIPPMVMPFDPTASIPLALISVASPAMDEKQLYDIAYFDLRNRLQGISGVIAPAVYGGKLRRILAYVDREKLEARNLSSMDVVDALNRFNLMIPTGNAKLGDLDYQINANSMVEKVDQLNDFPIRVQRGSSGQTSPIFLRDVAHAEDSAQIQTNIVRVNGKRQVYIPIYRQPGANTIQVVDGVRGTLERILQRLPKGISLDVVMDQSEFVRKAIRSLEEEAVVGTLLAGLMVLLFLGSFRPTLVVLFTLPLAFLSAFLGLYFSGESINTMTLGGLALAVGLLIDQAIVVTENIARHMEEGKPAFQASLDATSEVARPVFIITLTIIVVFFPVVFLTGIGRFLFTPLAISVAFAMLASYILAMTAVPSYCGRFLKSGGPGSAKLERAFVKTRDTYSKLLNRCFRSGKLVLVVALLVFVGSVALVPWIGMELFPQVDAGQIIIQVRAPSGTRVELTEELVKQVEAKIKGLIPEQEIRVLISNIGVLYDWPAAYTPNSGPHDAFVNVQLSEKRRQTALRYTSLLREQLPPAFPGTEFSFNTGGVLTAALNFGLPSPLNIQIEGNDLQVAYGLAEQIRDYTRSIPGAVDVRIQQRLDYPQIGLQVDRIKAANLGLTQEDVVKNVVTALNSSVNFKPSFWIDQRNGNHYFLGAQYPEKDIATLDTLKDIPITSPSQSTSIPLRTLASFERTTAPAEINHRNITRVVDIYANVSGRDLGAVAHGIQNFLDNQKVPSGYFVHMRGEFASLMESFQNLGFGLSLAIGLVYLVMVIQFRSFVDPLIVMTSVPLGIVGTIWMFLLTRTYLSIPALMGIIMTVGIGVSFSVLLIDFADAQRRAGKSAREAMDIAAAVRFRPIVMTSVSAVLGLTPMAVAGGANIPLARAVIGGVLASLVVKLFIVPLLYVMFKGEGSR